MAGCCESEAPAARHRARLTIALAGNPNCGKSALFNAFTGIRQKTGNWPGVTVDRKEGRFELEGREVAAIDLPGIYSFDASSIDERVSRDYLLSRDADLVVNVVDASNLERNLYLTVQLLEMGVPLVVALNMMDVARKRGISIDTEHLARELGCPVVPVVAVSGEGTTELKARMLAVADGREQGGFPLALDEVVEQAISDLEPLLAELPPENRRWLTLKLIESGDDSGELEQPVHEKLEYWRHQIAERAGEDADVLIADTRYGHAHTLAQTVTTNRGKVTRTLSDRIDRVVLGKWTGIPLFLVIMYLMFLFTMNIGGAFVDFFDGTANALFVGGLGELLSGLGAPNWLRVFLADGIGGGIQIVSTFIPIIGALYLFLSALEDSGYMARAAFVMDRSMRAIGLPGKAFVPLIVGFGCNVPAIMATRTLENERERKLTILMNPFMSCGARLPVYALFAAAFFQSSGQNIVFALYLTGIAVAILTGLLMKKSLLPGTSSGFLMELPPYHLPTLKGISLRAWDRVRLFVKEAGQVIILMVLALNLLNSIGTDGSFGNEDSEKSVLSAVSRTLAPAFEPMGIERENWPAVVGVISGVLAKEVVVGTLDNLYSGLASNGAAGREQAFDLWRQLREAAATVPANLRAIGDALLDPIGLDLGDLSDTGAIAEEQGVKQGVFGAMKDRFDGQIGAFAYLLFVLLYFPCVATVGAITREAGRPWAMFVAAWTTTVAYITATSFYQIATFGQHPGSSTAWLTGLWLGFALLILALRRWGHRHRQPAAQTASVEA
ncbi:MAG TPA: Fe(2+) transporter permease subunit FeoB [Gammaproteobacteria bacterium]|nr:Fe(2+) transporter permease subunit FeoB [Gammaproteobacteria bacterium]